VTKVKATHDLHDGRAGSLIMQALGDAIGFIAEGYDPKVCAPYAREVFLGSGPPQYFGQYSDDTQLARELALSLTTKHPAKEFARRLAALIADERNVIGYGPTTLAAAHKLIAGARWDEAAAPPPNASNGAAMRAGPVGFLNADDDELIRIADEQARITHADMRARAAAILVAVVVADAIRCGPTTADQPWFDRLAKTVESYDALLASGVRKMPDWLNEDPATVCKEITAWSAPPTGALHPFSRWDGISPFATPSVLYALFAYSRAPNDPEEVLHIAVAVGGDVDTVGAMAGAMVGAAVGLDGLTPRLAKMAGHLNDQGAFGVDDLIEIARAVK